MTGSSTIIDWLDENALRAYPLKADQNTTSSLSYELDQGVLLDALLELPRNQETVLDTGADGVTYGTNSFTSSSVDFLSSYRNAVITIAATDYRIVEVFDTNTVYLDQYLTASTGISFVVKAVTVPDQLSLTSIIVASNDVTFVLSNGASLNIPDKTTVTYPYDLRDSGNNLLVIGEAVQSIPEGVHAFGLAFEPALCVELLGEWKGVTSIQAYKTYDTASDGVLPSLPLNAASTPTRTGVVEFLSGYQVDVRTANNNINLYVGPARGIPVTCEDEFISDLTKDCGDIISYINGVGPDADGVFRFSAGQNIYITQENTPFTDAFEDSVEDHTLFIGFNFQETALCEPINIYPNSV